MDSHNNQIDKAALCELIRSAREDVGMSLDELSATSGVWKTGLKRLEAGDPRTTISTIETCMVALEARGVRFLYGGEVTDPSYTVPGMKVRRPSHPRKGLPRREDKPSYLPPGWQGRYERTPWGLRIVHGSQ
jgi:transcriptional regulator with XRE-family HTH domain